MRSLALLYHGRLFHCSMVSSNAGLFYAPANAFLHTRLIPSRQAI